MEYLVAYEFYCKSKHDEPHLIGILPERRKDKNRITHESIMNWGKMFLGDEPEFQNLFFVQVMIEKTTGEIFEPNSGSQKDNFN
ncbi:MAG: hypothetical protein QME83_11360 [Thermodesulfobacteriota bacterium]|nr:hypothetical protein [Thermodesulfobacteriota bacterium]